MTVRIEQLNKFYGQTKAVDNVSLEIEKHSLHFFLGPSGCGKTTTLRILAGLEKASSGKIFFDDKDVTNLSSAERNVAMVFQNYALWPHMTVKENVSYGLKLRKISPSEMQARIDEVIALTQLDGYRDRLPGQLSGGQQQRVALARALAIKPSILFLDEPLSNLDARLRLEMRDAICDIHKKTNITMIYVTHDQREALSMGSAVSVMRKGQLIQTSSPRELYHKPATSFIAQFIGQTNLIEGKVQKIEQDFVEVTTAIGNFKGSSFQSEQAVGDRVHLSLRPESFALAETQPLSLSTTNVLDGFYLDDTSFLGEAQMLYLKNRDGQHLKVKLFHSSKLDWRKGEVLNLTIPIDDVVVLPFATAEELSQAT